jgi:Ser/Thr protein kinase RdoA (MazF antagonist)
VAGGFRGFPDKCQLTSLVQAWLEGYRRVAPLSAVDEAEIWTFILFRGDRTRVIS